MMTETELGILQSGNAFAGCGRHSAILALLQDTTSSIKLNKVDALQDDEAPEPLFLYYILVS